MKITALLLASLFSSVALGQDGKALYAAKLCATCHGMDGIKPTAPIYPSLAGADLKCLKEQYNAIKTGKRTGAAVAMTAMIKTVKDDEADKILKYLAGLKHDTSIKNPATTVCNKSK